MTTKILFIGDIVNHLGITVVEKLLPKLHQELEMDLVIANAENVNNGRGITLKEADRLFEIGVNVLTGGNHTWDKEKIGLVFEKYPNTVLRPANYPEGASGKGYTLVPAKNGETIAVINTQGRLFMQAIDCPFQVTDRLLKEIQPITPLIVIDFHAEATAEKIAYAHAYDGKVSAVMGTHTHVPTADTCILPNGTAFQCDVGMTGAHDGVIGMELESVIQAFRIPTRMQMNSAQGDLRLNGVWIEIENQSGKALHIQRIERKVK
ncbi:MAG: TIGR00282 family metallophosphoesterase [bacterium]|nr:TIGR00282 family metallophosphoesterase [bacterium]